MSLKNGLEGKKEYLNSTLKMVKNSDKQAEDIKKEISRLDGVESNCDMVLQTLEKTLIKFNKELFEIGSKIHDEFIHKGEGVKIAKEEWNKALDDKELYFKDSKLFHLTKVFNEITNSNIISTDAEIEKILNDTLYEKIANNGKEAIKQCELDWPRKNTFTFVNETNEFLHKSKTLVISPKRNDEKTEDYNIRVEKAKKAHIVREQTRLDQMLGDKPDQKWKLPLMAFLNQPTAITCTSDIKSSAQMTASSNIIDGKMFSFRPQESFNYDVKIVRKSDQKIEKIEISCPIDFDVYYCSEKDASDPKKEDIYKEKGLKCLLNFSIEMDEKDKPFVTDVKRTYELPVEIK